MTLRATKGFKARRRGWGRKGKLMRRWKLNKIRRSLSVANCHHRQPGIPCKGWPVFTLPNSVGISSPSAIAIIVEMVSSISRCRGR
ncbi:hypothetical protein M413DRAFT_450050 [Hebeloma cylindrosporum]|nr:hypothetical protein M413DRAFT_450050 [Hebeloma cylindrosporum h7]